MSGNRAAIRYAKALLRQATGSNQESILLDDMNVIYNTIQNNKKLQLMLKNPIVKGDDKKAVLLEVFKNQSELTKSLINILAENKRIPLLKAISQSVITLHNKEKGIETAEVITAVPLTKELEQKVYNKVKEITGSTEVSLTNKVDESILGGFILRVGDLQYNASIANNLATIKREFSKSI